MNTKSKDKAFVQKGTTVSCGDKSNKVSSNMFMMTVESIKKEKKKKISGIINVLSLPDFVQRVNIMLDQ